MQMNNLSPNELEQALKVCADEPIHQIGTIQPHGALLVFSADTQQLITQASVNLSNFIEVPGNEACGKPLAGLFDETAHSQIEKLIEIAHKKQTATGSISVPINQISCDIPAHLYLIDESVVLELSHDEGKFQEAHLAQLLMEFQRTLLEEESDIDTLQYFDAIAPLVRTLTGYDNVMVYRFDSNWDGEVISQDRAEFAPSFLGQHFPASDIPPQARQLYTRNLVRVVADVEAPPVAILPALNLATQTPLDLTYSWLRSLSPIHLEYLRNIGVQASMVISLLQNGRLWGLIACHHKSPKRVSMSLRDAAIFISRMASAKLSSIRAIEQQSKVDKANHHVNELLKSITNLSVGDILQKLLPDLMTLLDSSGMILVVEGNIYLHGEVPKADAIEALLSWLKTQPGQEVYSCDYLSKQFSPALDYTAIASGVLTTPLSSELRSCIIWLRKEKPSTVNWAGHYEAGLVQNPVGRFRLTPRKSFEMWTESWLGRSAPWSPVDIGIAAMLALTIPEVLSQKSRIEHEHIKRKLAEDEIRNLAFYDQLTKLPNRRILEDRLCQTMLSSKRNGHYVALLFLDLDNFKPLNDEHGHDLGDLLLIEVANRLKGCVREIDTVVRYGGDEFVVLISDLEENEAESKLQTEFIAEKIRSALGLPYILQIQQEGRGAVTVEHHCTSSIGAVLFINHDVNQIDIIKLADRAMYRAKEAGRNLIRFHEF
jgi:diguanylate cyclase (GGDEF)-like protein